MEENGYSFRTQEQLKDYCTNSRIDLELYRGIYEPNDTQIDHIRVLEMINYCSLGHYEKAVALVLKVNHFLRDWRISWRISRDFIRYFLRSYLLAVRCNLECDMNINLTAFPGFLDSIQLHNQDLQSSELVNEYMKAMRDIFRRDGLASLKLFQQLRR